MTKKIREQVVELLRCAADIAACQSADFQPLQEAWDGIEPDITVNSVAWSVYDAAQSAWGSVSGKDDSFCWLEAAARVEEGSWP